MECPKHLEAMPYSDFKRLMDAQKGVTKLQDRQKGLTETYEAVFLQGDKMVGYYEYVLGEAPIKAYIHPEFVNAAFKEELASRKLIPV